MDRLPKIHPQKLLKQRLDSPFEKENETMDTLTKIQGQKHAKIKVRFPI